MDIEKEMLENRMRRDSRKSGGRGFGPGGAMSTGAMRLSLGRGDAVCGIGRGACFYFVVGVAV